ncbi:MAG: dUTPase [Limnochordia bacterium]
MDKLEHIFEKQRSFDEELIQRRGIDFDMATWVQKETLAIISELAELIDEVNFKWWKNPREMDRERITEELVDVLHFFVSMCLKVGLSADDLYQAYLVKNEENFRRQDGKSLKEGYTAPTK